MPVFFLLGISIKYLTLNKMHIFNSKRDSYTEILKQRKDKTHIQKKRFI